MKNMICNNFDGINEILKNFCLILQDKNSSVYDYINEHKTEYKMSVELGKCGWVYPGCLDNCFFGKLQNGYDAEHYVVTARDEFEKECVERKLCKTVIEEIDKLNYYKNNMYYERAKKYYFCADFTIAAMCLMPLLESEVNMLLKDFCKNKRNKEKYSEKFFNFQGEKIFNTMIKDAISKNVLFLHIFPSLCSYMKKIYYKCEKDWENEPEYIKRDFIFHGKSKREVREIECIQLFVALYNVAFVNTITNKSVKN